MPHPPPDFDTSIGGGKRDFPSTCWSRFLDTFPEEKGRANSTMEELSSAYWKPVYAFIRTRWSKTNEDAKDLTQDFFVWMMESNFPARADRERGRFRAFVKVALEHYLCNEERRRRRQKRGGDRKFVPLDAGSDELQTLEISDRSERSPEENLDDAWRRELLARAAGLLEQRLEAEDKRVYWEVFRDFFLWESGEIDYREVAGRHGINTVDVSNYLMYSKRRFRTILADLVAETVRGEEELREEMRALFGDGGP